VSRFKIEAFIIRSSKLSEASRILTFFSRETGKIKGVAKGVGRPKSKLGGTVELFNQIEGNLYKKETSELGLLSDAALLDDFRGISGDPRKYGFAAAWCEVLDKTLPMEEPRPETYILTHEYFQTLHAVKSESSGLLFWSAMMKFISYEGYTPNFDECVCCGNVITSEKKMVSLERGGLVCHECVEVDEPVILVPETVLGLLRRMMSETLTQISEIPIDNKIGKKAAEVILALASYHMNLPRNLKSFKFIENLTGKSRSGL
jgi:DNA repair protein RecO (recombination protein O)